MRAPERCDMYIWSRTWKKETTKAIAAMMKNHFAMLEILLTRMSGEAFRSENVVMTLPNMIVHSGNSVP
jgi:hypothetical protein